MVFETFIINLKTYAWIWMLGTIITVAIMFMIPFLRKHIQVVKSPGYWIFVSVKIFILVILFTAFGVSL